MNREEAKILLQACSRAEEDPSTPEVVEALAMAANDPELSKWLQKEKEFDQVFSERIGQPQTPEGLQNTLYAIGSEAESAAQNRSPSFSRRIIRHNFWRAAGSFAAAAAVVALIAVLIFDPREATANAGVPEFFETVRSEMLENEALGLENSDPEAIHQFLKDQQAPIPAELPHSMKNLQHIGASFIDKPSQRIGVIQLRDQDGNHFRLFVVQMDAPDRIVPILPDMSLKEFQRVSLLTWNRGGKIHALVTTAPATVLEKFRMLEN